MLILKEFFDFSPYILHYSSLYAKKIIIKSITCRI
uniref:Uncharacterized protein n=1 Tax=Siphoviridae sp. ctiJm4 TaxID=2827916 RepID=A0A8S5T106_9CAUD|nr:MAG TPA: hypothetical protein [Siphoviridae sp. ctiJm4]